MKRDGRPYEEALEALVAAIELRDQRTGGHSGRVASYSVEIGKAMGCSPGQLKRLALGAYLHDVGKKGIPEGILRKPRELTPRERLVIEGHARIGYDLVRRNTALASTAFIVLTHQERYDGKGYPQGLSGKQIPLCSRIIAVADTLDALTHDRPYHRAIPFRGAREEIARESGRQFDPEVVRAFLSIPERLWKEIRTALPGSRVRQTAEALFGMTTSPKSAGNGSARLRHTADSLSGNVVDGHDR